MNMSDEEKHKVEQEHILRHLKIHQKHNTKKRSQ